MYQTGRPGRKQDAGARKWPALSRMACYIESNREMSSVLRTSLASLARRWSALRTARAEADAAREFWDAGAPGETEDRYWGSQPLVRRAINRRVSGDPNRWPMEWFAQKYVPQAMPLGLSVGLAAI